MAEMITIDPELEGLLREVAADPESSLLRVPRGKRIRSLLEKSVPLGRDHTCLSLAEQQILQVHKSELAYLLRQSCLLKLLKGTRSKFFNSRYITVDRTLDIPNPYTLGAQVAACRIANAADTSHCSDVLKNLERCISEPQGGTPSVTTLATASFQLEHTDEARILAAMDLVQHKGERAALALLQPVLDSHADHNHISSALSQIGLAYSAVCALPKSHDAYVALCSHDDEVLVAWLSRMVLAFQIGNEKDIAYVADRLADPQLLVHRAVNHFIISQRHLRHAQEWSPTSDATRLLKKRGGALEGITGLIANVLA